MESSGRGHFSQTAERGSNRRKMFRRRWAGDMTPKPLKNLFRRRFNPLVDPDHFRLVQENGRNDHVPLSVHRKPSA